MWLLDEHKAEVFLRDRGWIEPKESVDIQPLCGGVSNQVLCIRRHPVDKSFVLKQARPQLRVADPWFCSVERYAREIAVIETCNRLLDSSDGFPASSVTIPRILRIDGENYCFAMTAAPPDHAVWKAILLGGQADVDIARQCGTLLGTLHAQSWSDDRIAQELGDRQFFIELRIDPYYRHLAQAFSGDAQRLENLIDSVLANRHCLVHADFSPKNLLIYHGGLMLVDFETGHYGDPAFDLGFFLSHLVLKAIYRAPDATEHLNLIDAFWRQYIATLSGAVTPDELLQLEQRTVLNLAGCLWARLDGKSKIDYLTDTTRQDTVRKLARSWLYETPELAIARRELAAAIDRMALQTTDPN